MSTAEHGLPVPLDTDRPTLHVRCGSDIRTTLQAAGFIGDFLEYSDPVCQGPVPDGPDLMPRRAQFLTDAFGGLLGFTTAQSLHRLKDEEQRLNAAHNHERVVLWFEHDSHDQLVLARCLSHFANHTRPARLELICIDRHPAVARFIGLGQLEPQALASLWPQRAAVSQPQLDLGRAIWTAMRQPDPSALAAIAAMATPALPVAAPALRRHLQELPGVADGLSKTQRILLAILADGPTTIGHIFGALMQGREPLPFLGDLGFLYTVEQMASTRPAVITIQPGDKPFPRLASITDAGRRLLAGQLDYLSLQPPRRWIGGVPADGRWRWDEIAGEPVLAS